MIGDAELILASIDEPVAFETVFDRYHGRIFGYLARRVGPDVAEDLASEVFVAAFRQRGTFHADAISAAPWLFGIAANLARHHHRSQRRGRLAFGRAAERGVIWLDPDLEQRVDAARLGEELARSLQSLRVKDREILLLYALADLSYREIAAALGIPIGTVRSRLSRTRERLRNHPGLTGQLGNEPPTQLPEGGG
jgi:RNA polymerase sigma factor (sigma-70 family)